MFYCSYFRLFLRAVIRATPMLPHCPALLSPFSVHLLLLLWANIWRWWYLICPTPIRFYVKFVSDSAVLYIWSANSKPLLWNHHNILEGQFRWKLQFFTLVVVDEIMTSILHFRWINLVNIILIHLMSTISELIVKLSVHVAIFSVWKFIYQDLRLSVV